MTAIVAETQSEDVTTELVAVMSLNGGVSTT